MCDSNSGIDVVSGPRKNSLSVLTIASVFVKAVMWLSLLIDEAVKTGDDLVILLVTLVATIVHAFLTVILAVSIVVVFQSNDTDLAITTLATAPFLAILQALVQSSPFKVEEGDNHHRETYVNGNDHGPFGEFFYWSVNHYNLVVEFEVTRAARHCIAVSHDPHLIRALERELLSNLCHDVLLSLGLIHPEIGMERSEQVHFSTLRNLRQLHIDSLSDHL